MKPDSQEASLKDMQNHPTIYGYKATQFKFQTRIKYGPKPDRSYFQASSWGQIFTEVFDVPSCRLVNEREDSFIKFVKSHKVGVTPPFKTPSRCNNYRVNTKKIPVPPSPLLYFLLYYLIWPHRRSNCTHTYKGEQVSPQVQAHQGFMARQTQGMYQKDVVENLHQILQYKPQVWLTKEIQPGQDILSLTHMVCPKSTGGQQKTQSQTSLLEGNQIK